MSIEKDEDQTGTRTTRSVEGTRCRWWELQLPLEGTGISSAVSAVEYLDKIYAFYIKKDAQGARKLGYLIMGKTRGDKIAVESSQEHSLPGLTGLAPAATVYNGRLHCFYTGSDQRLRYVTYARNQWSAVATVPGVLTVAAPSVTTCDNKLYIALQGTYNGEFYYKTLTDSNWDNTTHVPAINFKGSPSLCVFREKLHVAICGMDNLLHVFKFENRQWMPIYRSSFYEVLDSPALHPWNNSLCYSALRKPTRNYFTGFVPSPGESKYVGETIGTYLSSPCMIDYKGAFYLMGQRPCNDLGISIFAPNCTDRN